jgi:hypothetical protein
MQKPKLFIGSSSEELQLTRRAKQEAILARELKRFCDTLLCWCKREGIETLVSLNIEFDLTKN